MKRTVIAASVGLPLLLLALGCTRTRLARRPPAPYERAWNELIHHSYPRWRPPAYPQAMRSVVHPVRPMSGVRPTGAPGPAPPAATQDVELVPLTPAGDGH